MKLVVSHIPSDMYFAPPGGILVDPAPDSCHYAAFASPNPVTPRRLPLGQSSHALTLRGSWWQLVCDKAPVQPIAI